MVAPIIPALTDHEIEPILAAAAEAGAVSAGYVLVRLPHEVKDLMAAWLEAHFPGRAAHVLSLIRQCRDGRLNDPEFGSRMRGAGPFAELIRQRFQTGQPPPRLRPPPDAAADRPVPAAKAGWAGLDHASQTLLRSRRKFRTAKIAAVVTQNG